MNNDHDWREEHHAIGRSFEFDPKNVYVSKLVNSDFLDIGMRVYLRRKNVLPGRHEGRLQSSDA